ncbi:MAG: hypothetical protein HY722_14620 [Planctomycetes bacterium]|nr:hypothetical protein [Planctomycetota bacterium]
MSGPALLFFRAGGPHPWCAARWRWLAGQGLLAGVTRRSRARDPRWVLGEVLGRLDREHPGVRVALVGDAPALEAAAGMPPIGHALRCERPWRVADWARAALEATGGETPAALWVVYPDALGMGFLPAEVAALQVAAGDRAILSARGRRVPLDGWSVASFAWRRTVVKLWLVELAASLLFLAALPALVLPALATAARRRLGAQP